MALATSSRHYSQSEVNDSAGRIFLLAKSRSMKSPSILQFVLSAALFAQASAAPILGVTATSPNTNLGGVPANVVNGSGLIGGILPTSQHSQSGTNTAWLSGASAANTQLDFDLGDLYSLSGLAFWNANGDFVSRGISTLQILSSVDGLTYSLISGSPTTFAQVPTAPSSAEIFSWAPVAARFVRFDVATTYNGNGALVNEVLFDGEKIVPELDGSTALVPFTTMCLALLSLKRRRKSRHGWSSQAK